MPAACNRLQEDLRLSIGAIITPEPESIFRRAERRRHACRFPSPCRQRAATRKMGSVRGMRITDSVVAGAFIAPN
jgi:hypothetical protein